MRTFVQLYQPSEHLLALSCSVQQHHTRFIHGTSPPAARWHGSARPHSELKATFALLQRKRPRTSTPRRALPAYSLHCVFLHYFKVLLIIAPTHPNNNENTRILWHVPTETQPLHTWSPAPRRAVGEGHEQTVRSSQVHAANPEPSTSSCCLCTHEQGAEPGWSP